MDLQKLETLIKENFWRFLVLIIILVPVMWGLSQWYYGKQIDDLERDNKTLQEELEKLQEKNKNLGLMASSIASNYLKTDWSEIRTNPN